MNDSQGIKKTMTNSFIFLSTASFLRKTPAIMLVTLCMWLSISNVQAQRNELGLSFGGSFYMGDLNPTTPFVMVNPAAGGLYRLNFSNHFSIRANIYYMRVEGNDSYLRYNTERDLSFFSDIYEFSLQAEVNFMRFQPGNLKTPFTPFLFAGAGGFLFHPKRIEQNGQITDLLNLTQNPHRETNYNLLSHSFLFGFGFKANVSKLVSTGLEWGMRRTGTDYLDDVSYGQPPEFVANPKNNDWYSFFGAVITFKINDPSRAVCPYSQ